MGASRQRIHAAAVVLLVAGRMWALEPHLEEVAREVARNGLLMGLAVEQGDQMVAVSHGDEVWLRREPFALWVVFGDTDAVELQVSSDRTVHDAIGPGSTLSDTLGSQAEMIMGMGEYDHNLERTLFIDSFAVHYLPNPRSDPRHRFNRIYFGPFGNEFIAGGRDTEWLVDQTNPRARRKFSVANVPVQVLYVTAFVSEYDAEYRRDVKDFLAFTLVFRP